jgi:hypothetical protein
MLPVLRSLLYRAYFNRLFSFVRGSATSRYNARDTAAKEQIDGLFNSQLRGDGALR